ncbi:MAG TPA: MltA domain-containing protein [Caulobacteraceae bacterium]|nr:MltA domain-containing protein [Caulobacteraceae bacterium]
MRIAAAAACALLAAACATQPRPSPPGPFPDEPRPPAAAVPLSSLPGWAGEDHAGALRAWKATCHVAQDAGLRRACADARALSADDSETARRWLERTFAAEPIDAPGLLTAYFAPEYEAREAPEGAFTAAVRPVPPDLVRGQPYLTREEIESWPEPSLAWMRPEDLFFMQIQGSGYLTFPDGRRARAAYAADNARPFTGIAKPMVEQGLLAPNQTSGETIRAWLAAHAGAEAQAVMNLNQRYIFFALQPDDGGHPAGAAGVPLPARRAVAVDPAFTRYGQPVWLDADGGTLAGAAKTYRGFAVALDTGGAIKGPARADFYMGRGDAAGLEAGRVKHPLRMWRLVAR